jgi:hypothetical protein
VEAAHRRDRAGDRPEEDPDRVPALQLPGQGEQAHDRQGQGDDGDLGLGQLQSPPEATQAQAPPPATVGARVPDGLAQDGRDQQPPGRAGALVPPCVEVHNHPGPRRPLQLLLEEPEQRRLAGPPGALQVEHERVRLAPPAPAPVELVAEPLRQRLGERHAAEQVDPGRQVGEGRYRVRPAECLPARAELVLDGDLALDRGEEAVGAQPLPELRVEQREPVEELSAVELAGALEPEQRPYPLDPAVHGLGLGPVGGLADLDRGRQPVPVVVVGREQLGDQGVGGHGPVVRLAQPLHRA